MAISIGDLQVVYSGGAGNVDQQTSLGGAISTAAGKKIISQTASAPVNVTGVTILDAMGNAEGGGTLIYNGTTHSLTWKPFGGTTNDGLIVSADGLYTLGTAGGYIYVQVVYASLPVGTLQDTITITNAVNKAFDNISAVESLNGDTEYRCFYLVNTHATDTAYDVRLWIKAQPVGSDTLSLSLDTNGKNGTARGPLTGESDPTSILTGVTWSAPSSYATALLLGNLAPSDKWAFWVKRVVPQNTTAQVVNDISSLAISALV